ncbi:alkyl sulfatase dimerization domain-containing protein [uncultured Sphingorhabdus sp.]|uniref:MBL fold metallo-hydrolase n=1 Tax=uncultured Sphingorhabdus sp. TaxID=1686106 RepID=UPI00261C44D7|nr:alkyl sulfatase dimerization domain-containing protein [uncultured Sphingorhabdus sp.]HMS19874.1 alkyl sulfatase dimerization domain-containing protein [Sphingorhabdus sp.]
MALSEDDTLVRQGRALIAREYPDVLRNVFRNDGFGGPGSQKIANAMLVDSPELVAAAKAGMTVERHGDGMWLIRFPYVNVALIETKRGLVIFDTGYASIGPVLAEVIPTLSPKPLTHIIVSHIHVDHAYGWPALKKRWPEAKTVTSDLFPKMAAKEVRLGGSIGRLNNQPLESWPTSVNRLPKPDIVFRDRLGLKIDGEIFDLRHAPGETEEQIWLALPSRRAIFTADYYQGFLPNAGNGKRILRHIDEWADAFRQMVALRPSHLLPMHNAAINDDTEIARILSLNADALEHISKQVVARLNAGERRDAIAAGLDWPERFAKAPELDPQYNRPEDIARMVSLRWTGWWDSIPSHFPAMPFEVEAEEALRLAGGVDAIDKRARELLATDTRLAARLADWAYFGAPNDAKALRLTIDVYMTRLAEKDMPLQEATVYLDHASLARAKLAALEPVTTP